MQGDLLCISDRISFSPYGEHPAICYSVDEPRAARMPSEVSQAAQKRKYPKISFIPGIAKRMQIMYIQS